MFNNPTNSSRVVTWYQSNVPGTIDYPSEEWIQQAFTTMNNQYQNMVSVLNTMTSNMVYPHYPYSPYTPPPMNFPNPNFLSPPFIFPNTNTNLFPNPHYLQTPYPTHTRHITPPPKPPNTNPHLTHQTLTPPTKPIHQASPYQPTIPISTATFGDHYGNRNPAAAKEVAESEEEVVEEVAQAEESEQKKVAAAAQPVLPTMPAPPTQADKGKLVDEELTKWTLLEVQPKFTSKPDSPIHADKGKLVDEVIEVEDKEVVAELQEIEPMAMKGFAEKIVNLLKSENLYKTQGGPIILSQIENEYGPQAKMLGTPGLQYAAWAANMTFALDTGVPWVMCKEEDAPDPVINTCNGFYCDVFSPNKPYKPAMWTEAWSGWFSEFGGSTHERSVQDLAFGVARNYEGKFTDTIEKLGVNSDDGKAYIKACGAIGNDSFKEETIFNRLFPLIKVVFLYTSQGHIAVVLSSNIRVLGTRLFKKESAVTTRLKDGRELNGPRDNIGIG